eukprot:15468368-Alexandrium_andersonii.AAC.1
MIESATSWHRWHRRDRHEIARNPMHSEHCVSWGWQFANMLAQCNVDAFGLPLRPWVPGLPAWSAPLRTIARRQFVHLLEACLAAHASQDASHHHIGHAKAHMDAHERARALARSRARESSWGRQLQALKKHASIASCTQASMVRKSTVAHARVQGHMIDDIPHA